MPTRDSLLELIHPEDRAAWFAAYGEARVSGNSEVHYRIRRPTGEERILRSVVRAEHDAAGQPTYLLGTMQDVTEAHRAQRALRDSEERLSRVLAASNDGWWDSDLVTGDAFHSDRWWQIHGYEPGELPDALDTWRGLTDPADLDRIDREFRAVLDRRLPTLTFHGHVEHKQGHLVPVVVRALIDYDEDGQPIRISGITTDVTEAKQAERAVRESEERLSRVLAASNDGWWEIEPTTGVAFHSDRWWQIHGYAPGELPNLPDTWRELADPVDLVRVDREFEAVLALQLPAATFHFRATHKKGHLVPLVVSLLIEYDEEGQPIRISSVTADVTETRRAEMLKDRLVSTVSHELRTPLTSIGGALTLVQDGAVGAVPDRVGELIEIARRNTVRLRLLVDDLLDMERLLADGQPFTLTVQDLEPLIEAAVTDLGPYAASLGVRYEITGRSADAAVAVDAARLQQVLANYLSNAAKFAPEGSAVEVRTRPVARGVRVEVIDRGPGVPQELGDTVFDKFVQAYPEDLRGPTGTGLGLAISREIVQRLGGQVGFESRPGRTCFWFDLPTAPPKQD